MKTVAVRIPQGKDLVQEIERILREYDIEAGAARWVVAFFCQ